MDLLLIIVLLLVIFAVFGGVAWSPWLFLVLVIALIVLFAGRPGLRR
jgi:hypothetical protein